MRMIMLDTDKLDYGIVRDIKSAFIWNRNGEQRLIPFTVLDNLHQLFRDYSDAYRAGLIWEIPQHCLTLRWEQTTPLTDEPEFANKPIQPSSDKNACRGEVNSPPPKSFPLARL